jgi:hypothetical protein
VTLPRSSVASPRSSVALLAQQRCVTAQQCCATRAAALRHRAATVASSVRMHTHAVLQRYTSYDIRACAAFSCSSDEAWLIALRICAPSSAFGTFSPTEKRSGRRRSMEACCQQFSASVRNAG